jgi:hypothetical protein
MTVTITTAPRRRRRWGRLRGTAAVIVLLLSALEALLSAVTGFPPLTYIVRRFAAAFAVAYRTAAHRPVPAGPPVVIRTTPAPTSKESRIDGEETVTP